MAELLEEEFYGRMNECFEAYDAIMDVLINGWPLYRYDDDTYPADYAGFTSFYTDTGDFAGIGIRSDMFDSEVDILAALLHEGWHKFVGYDPSPTHDDTAYDVEGVKRTRTGRR